MFEVRLKQSHSTGTYRRAGKIFKANEPVVMETVPAVVAKDPWLVVTKIEEPKKEAPKGK